MIDFDSYLLPSRHLDNQKEKRRKIGLHWPKRMVHFIIRAEPHQQWLQHWLQGGSEKTQHFVISDMESYIWITHYFNIITNSQGFSAWCKKVTNSEIHRQLPPHCVLDNCLLCGFMAIVKFWKGCTFLFSTLIAFSHIVVIQNYHCKKIQINKK